MVARVRTSHAIASIANKQCIYRFIRPKRYGCCGSYRSHSCIQAHNICAYGWPTISQREYFRFQNFNVCHIIIIIQSIVWMHADCQMLLILLSKWCKPFGYCICLQQYDASIEKRVLIIVAIPFWNGSHHFDQFSKLCDMLAMIAAQDAITKLGKTAK